MDVAVTVTHTLELVLADREVVMFDVGVTDNESVEVIFDVGIETVAFVTLKGGGIRLVDSEIFVEFKDSVGMLNEVVVGRPWLPLLPIFVGVPM